MAVVERKKATCDSSCALNCAAVEGVIYNDPEADPNNLVMHNPQAKPHGRLCWSIQLGGGAYIDLAVMPLVKANMPRRAEDVA